MSQNHMSIILGMKIGDFDQTTNLQRGRLPLLLKNKGIVYWKMFQQNGPSSH